MTDAEYAAIMDRLAAIREQCAPLRPAGWHITYKYVRGYSDNHRDAVMDCRADWRYQHATITTYVERIWAGDIDDEELRSCWVHELMHVHLHECRTYAGEHGWDYADLAHEERVATQLATAILDYANSIADHWRKECPNGASCPVADPGESQEAA